MYGEHLTPFEIKELLEYVFEINLKREIDEGERPVPICIWGKHGLGKTASVYSFAKSKGWQIEYCQLNLKKWEISMVYLLSLKNQMKLDIYHQRGYQKQMDQEYCYSTILIELMIGF